MSNAAGPGGAAEKLGLKEGSIVLELGWDDDVDDDLRIAIEDAIDGELLEDAMEAVDAVLLWWRDGDGDLVDGLVDALTDLSAEGVVWLLTPKVGRLGHVEAAEIAESATAAGFPQTSVQNVSTDWTATRLVRPRGGRR